MDDPTPAGLRGGTALLLLAALLHIPLTEGAEVAATLTPVLAEVLIATARARADEQDRLARYTYDQGRAARAEICRLLATAPLDSEDLLTLRGVLEERERPCSPRPGSGWRLAEQRHEVGGAPGVRRLGVGWPERYWGQAALGPYLRVRCRQVGAQSG